MSLHLPTLDTDKMEVKASYDGRVYVFIGGHCALLTLSVEQARSLANGLQNACVELAMPVEVAA